MPGLFGRLKVWLGLDVVQNSDLNAEFDNIINNVGPSKISGWSASASQMRVQTSPGSFNSESLSTSTSDELERIRYQLNAIIGGPDGVWYDQPSLSLSQVNTALPNQLPKNRIVSGAVVSGTNQPGFLVAPGGTTKTVTLKCSSTPFVVVINGTTYTFSSDITSSTLTLAPSSNNTFALNDSNCDASAKTKNFGDFICDIGSNTADATQRFGSSYPIVGNTVGSGLTGLGGTFQAFSYTHSAVTEYFVGHVRPDVSSTFINLNKCKRGFFFDSTNTTIKAIAMTNAENVTLCQLIWIYVTTSGTLMAVYTHPRYSPTQPSSSLSGDMWYDMVNQQWKQSNGSTYSLANAHLVGVCVTNTSGCVAARSFDPYAVYQNTSNVVVEWYSTTEYRTKYDNNMINVYGNSLNFDKDELRWPSSLGPASGNSYATSTSYWLYLDQTGVVYLDDIQPNTRQDLGGYYHPYQTWRCVGVFFRNGSGNFDQYAFTTFSGENGETIRAKSISVEKLKPTPWIYYDANVSSPFVAELDQISLSTVCSLSIGTQQTATQVKDGNSANITCALQCSGRTILIGLIADGTNSGHVQINNGTATTQIGGHILYYMNGVSVADIPLSSGGASSGSLELDLPLGATWTLINGVVPGKNTFTLFYLVNGANLQLSLSNARMFVKEI